MPVDYALRDPDRVPATGTMENRELAKLEPRDYAIMLILMAVGATARLFFLNTQGIPRFDPWRHLLLVENLRAGRGFTLFEGQPYIWYPPFWQSFAALMPRALGLDPRWEADFVFERYTLEKVLAGASSAGDLTAFFRGRGVTHLSFTKKYLIHHFLERRYFQKSVRGNKRHILSG